MESQAYDGVPSFGVELRRLRVDAGLSLRGLADDARVPYSFSYLWKLERGYREPNDEVAAALDEVLESWPRLSELAVARAARSRGGLRLSRPAQLPAPAAGFIGREQQWHLLDAVRDRTAGLGAVRLGVVEGAPGVGKTELALHWSHAAAVSFPDGQLYRNLHGFDTRPRVDAATVLEEWLRALGVPTVLIPPGAEQRGELFRSIASELRLLLVLDNAASSEQVLPLLPATPRCMVVVTSRMRLVGLVRRLGGLPITLGAFTPDQSQEVLRHLVGPQRVDAEPQAAATIARYCGYLPLAVRTAAAHAMLHPHRPLAEVADELSGRNRRLDALSPPEDPDSLREVFSSSYAELDPQTAALFRLLGLYPAPEVSTTAAAVLTECSVPAARRQLERLANAHVIEPAGPDRWRCPDLLWLYAAERAHDEDSPQHRDQAIERLLHWYQHAVAAAAATLAPHSHHPPVASRTTNAIPEFDDHDSALRWAEREAATVVAAVNHARNQDMPTLAWQLAVASSSFFRLRTPWPLWLTGLKHGLHAARDAGDLRGQAWCHHELAAALTRLRRHTEALDHLDRAIQVRADQDDHTGLAWSICARGATYADLGRWDDAAAEHEHAHGLFRRVDNHYGLGITLSRWASVARHQHHVDQAQQWLHQALEIFTDAGAKDGEALAKLTLAETCEDPCTALQYAEAALDIYRDLADIPGQADALLQRGDILHDDDHREAARQSWREALALLEHPDEPRAVDARARLATVDDTHIA